MADGRFHRLQATVVSMIIGIFILLNLQTIAWAGQKASPVFNPDLAIKKIIRPFKGDLPAMKKRRYVRALVAYSKTNFFIEKGRFYGFEYEMLHQYEKFLNRGRKKQKWIKIFYIPVPFSELLRDIRAGKGDIAAAGLTITRARKKLVAFTRPYLTDISEIVVTNRNVPAPRSVYDLAGKRVYVRQGSSYIQHLRNLNGKLKSKHKKSLRIVVLKKFIGTEDILELVNAGTFKYTVCDSHLAKIWSRLLKNIRVYPNIAIHKGGKIAWAVRKGNPRLLKSLNTFIRKNRKGSKLGNILFRRYYEKTKWIKNPVSKSELRKLKTMEALFKKYGKKYHFSWYMIAAQAYQESGLDQSKKSPSGAVGVMQVLPKTARDKNIGIHNVRKLENNIHAGVKYLYFLREAYFNSKKIRPLDQVFFSWAAYNAGPNKINQLRRIAKKRGLNPNRWFYNVEEIAAEKIGRETVEYVSNIAKYYVAYKLYFQKVERVKEIKNLIKKKKK